MWRLLHSNSTGSSSTASHTQQTSTAPAALAVTCIAMWVHPSRRIFA
jgi:hypothetical protein